MPNTNCDNLIGWTDTGNLVPSSTLGGSIVLRHIGDCNLMYVTSSSYTVTGAHTHTCILYSHRCTYTHLHPIQSQVHIHAPASYTVTGAHTHTCILYSHRCTYTHLHPIQSQVHIHKPTHLHPIQSKMHIHTPASYTVTGAHTHTCSHRR